MIFLFDFDGVIIESNTVREYGFKQVLKNHSKTEIDKLLEYHNRNGGLSRYVKFNYFYKEIKGIIPTEKMIADDAEAFSIIMKKELGKKQYIIKDTLAFIKKMSKQYKMYIVSGSDQNELRFLCKELEVDRYFKEIYGSPVHKNELVRRILEEEVANKYVLIGDSINDYEAAKTNNISFAGFNNEALRTLEDYYIDDYHNFKNFLRLK